MLNITLRYQGRLGVTIMYQDENGKDRKIDRFIPYAESKMYDELYRSVDAAMVYGKKQSQMGPDGYLVKTGSLFYLIKGATLVSNNWMSISLIAGTPKCYTHMEISSQVL